MFHARIARLFVPLALLITATGCKPSAAPVDTAADNAALLAAAEAWPKAFNEGNADAVAALYADDAKILPPDMPMIEGKAAILEYFRKDLVNKPPKVTITVDTSGVGGDWGWRSGSVSVETTPPLTGKFVEVWRKTPEGWRLYRDIWNDNAAAPAAAPAAEPPPQ